MFGPVTRIKFGAVLLVPGSKVGDKSLGCLVHSIFTTAISASLESSPFLVPFERSFAHYDVNKEKQCSHISTIGMSLSNSNHSQNGLYTPKMFN